MRLWKTKKKARKLGPMLSKPDPQNVAIWEAIQARQIREIEQRRRSQTKPQ
jgi:hypothetical protein